MRTGGIALVISCVIALAAPAHGGGDERGKTQARQLYRVATQHYNLAEWDQALTAFREAYRLYEEPSFLFNIGQCYRQLGHNAEAVTFYRSYLRNVPDAPNRDEVRDLIDKLEAALAQEAAAKRAPPQGPREPGSTASTTQTADELRAAPPPVAVVAPAPPRPPRYDAHRGHGLRLAGLVVGSVGVVALVTGAALLGVAKGDDDTLNAPKAGSVFDAGLEDRVANLQTGGWVLVGVGGAAVVVGAVSFALGHRRAHEPIVASAAAGEGAAF